MLRRNLDPGRRLERPVYLTGLYYRSAFYNKASTRMFFPSNKPYVSITILQLIILSALVFLGANKWAVICSTSLVWVTDVFSRS